MPDSPPDRQTLCLRPPGGAQLALDLPRDLVSSALAHFGTWALGSSESAAAATLRVTWASGDAQSPHTLWADGSVFTTVETAEDAILGLQAWVDGQVALRASGVTPVHAGAVAWQGRGILFPGPSGAGKSRLVAALVEDGAEYLSDEFALIDHEGMIVPYARPLILRDEAGRQRSVAAATLGGTATAPVPVRLILALRFEAHGTWSLRPLAGSEAALVLLANSPRPLDPRIGMPNGIAVAAGAAAFSGTRGDANQTSARVRALCDTLTSP